MRGVCVRRFDSEDRMQGYQRNFEDEQRDQKEEETIVVDLVPPQYQLSPPESPPPGNMPKTPEKG